MNITVKDIVRQLSSFIAPIVVLIIIPFFIQRDFTIPLTRSQGLWPVIQFVAGLVLLTVGLGGFAWTTGLFIRIGKGTIMPWDPTHKLVVAGPYAHVRNPMIASLVVVLLGEAVFFGSWTILAWAVFAFALNHFYFIFSEEPGLAKRFGEEYEVYKMNVPRWIPRLRPWRPGSGKRV